VENVKSLYKKRGKGDEQKGETTASQTAPRTTRREGAAGYQRVQKKTVLRIIEIEKGGITTRLMARVAKA